MNRQRPAACPDCDTSVDRRDFLRTTGAAALVGATSPLWLGTPMVHAAPTPTSAAETTVVELYKSLSDEQKKVLCFPFENELRTRISANWHVTKPQIKDDFFTQAQRDTVKQILKGLTSEDGYAKLNQQAEDDAGGLGNFSMAIFGTPGSGKFQWEMTGRHLTLRADGDSVDKAAFGGPIVYGHGEEDPKANMYHYQTKQTNEVFKALDAKQMEKALIKQAPKEAEVHVQGDKGQFPGIGVDELSSDQKALVEKTLKVLLAPYRAEDVDEVMAILKAGGGLDKLHMAFYQQGDLASDKVWDIWRVEGPSFVWHFRGAPHVHAYINIALKS